MTDLTMKQPADPVLFSVVVPVFNSARSLEELHSGLSETFSLSGKSWEVIYVDDGSRDESWDVIGALKAADPGHVTGVRLCKNFGQHNATLCGLGLSRGQSVITLDDDLQIPPQEIIKLIETQERSGADLVYGVFGKKHHSVVRNLGSRSLKTSAKIFHGSRGEGSSFRLIRSELVGKILHHRHNFIFLDEVLGWYTDAIDFVPVEHRPRKYSGSGYTTAKLIRLFADIVLYYTMVPLKILVYGGFSLSVITFVIGVYFIVKKILYNVPLGYTSLIVTILFSTSIILFSLGVLGEYLSRIYQVQNRKPPYSVKKIV